MIVLALELLKWKQSMGSRFTHSNNTGRVCCGVCPALRHRATPQEHTQNYHVVNPNGLAETFFAFGEIFLQQVSLGQCQVVCTGGTSLKAQQLMGKCPVNKLWRNGTPAWLGEQANHAHPQKDKAGGLTRTYLTRKQTEDFFPPPLNVYLHYF